MSAGFRVQGFGSNSSGFGFKPTGLVFRASAYGGFEFRVFRPVASKVSGVGSGSRSVDPGSLTPQ